MRTLLIAMQGLRGAPLRSLLVVIALTLGMLGFVAVFSADRVLTDTVTQRALLAGGPPATFELSVTGPRTAEQADTVENQIARRTGSIASAVVVNDPDIGLWSDLGLLDRVAVSFVTTSLRDVRPFPLVDGSWLDDIDVLAPRVVVNEAAATLLGAEHGLSLGTVDTRDRVVVSGVVRDGETEPHAYAALSWRERVVSGTPTTLVFVHAPTLTQDDTTAAVAGLREFGAPFELNSVRRADRVDAYAAEVQTTSRVLFILGGLGVVSTVVGIMNVGLATARARSREFTMRRTMGAGRSHIAVIVIVESQILALTAALIAFGASYLLFPVILESFDLQLGIGTPSYSPLYGVICLVVASGTALVSSIVPALMSYRRDISSVMRE